MSHICDKCATDCQDDQNYCPNCGLRISRFEQNSSREQASTAAQARPLARATSMVLVAILIFVIIEFADVLLGQWQSVKRDEMEANRAHARYSAYLDSLSSGTPLMPEQPMNAGSITMQVPSQSAEQKPTPPRVWTRIASFEGNGFSIPELNTEAFTVGPEWKLRYKTSVGRHGSQGSLTVFITALEHQVGSGAGGLAIGQNGSGSGDQLEYGAGTYYLQIITDQRYSITVLDKK